jgi:putative hydrolase of the HAD superfamily
MHPSCRFCGSVAAKRLSVGLGTIGSEGVGDVQAVLYDFGGVFTRSPFDAVHEGSDELGLERATVFEVLFGPYGQDTDHPWHRLERGEITLAAARADLMELAAARGMADDPFTFLTRLGAVDEQREEVVERARAVKASGVRTALVTNNVAEFGDGWRSMIPVDELFDVVIDSSRAGVRKPDPAIFRAALDALDATASTSVFLDDYMGNVTAARDLGLRAIHVGADRLAAFEELERLLGLRT